MPGMPSSEPRFVSSSHHGVARSDEPPRHAGFCRSAPWARPLSPNDVLLSPAVAPKRRSYRGHSSSRRNRRRPAPLDLDLEAHRRPRCRRGLGFQLVVWRLEFEIEVVEDLGHGHRQQYFGEALAEAGVVAATVRRIRADLHVFGTRLGVAIDVELVGVRIELALEVRYRAAEIDHLAFLNQVAAEHEILLRRAVLRDRARIQAQSSDERRVGKEWCRTGRI